MRHGGQQRLGVVLARVGKELQRRGRFHDLALVHHHHAVGQVGDDAHVVGDQHDGRVELVAHLAQQLEDLGLHRHVQRGGRLVGDDQRRVQRERHGDDDALLLAAGELVRVVVDPLFGFRDADLAQHLDGAGLGLLLGDLAVGADALGDLPAHGVHGVQRGGGLLEHHGHVGAAHGTQLAAAEGEHVVAAQHHGPAGRGRLGQQAQHGACRDGLAGAGLADDGDHLAGGDLEADALHRSDLAGVGGEGDLEVLDAQHRSVGRGLLGFCDLAHAVALSAAALLLAAHPQTRIGQVVQASPTRVRPSTVSTMAAPGNTPVHQMPLVTSESARLRS